MLNKLFRRNPPKQEPERQPRVTHINGKRIVDGYGFHDGDKLVVRLTLEDGSVYYDTAEGELTEHP